MNPQCKHNAPLLPLYDHSKCWFYWSAPNLTWKEPQSWGSDLTVPLHTTRGPHHYSTIPCASLNSHLSAVITSSFTFTSSLPSFWCHFIHFVLFLIVDGPLGFVCFSDCTQFLTSSYRLLRQSSVKSQEARLGLTSSSPRLMQHTHVRSHTHTHTHLSESIYCNISSITSTKCSRNRNSISKCMEFISSSPHTTDASSWPFY